MNREQRAGWNCGQLTRGTLLLCLAASLAGCGGLFTDRSPAAVTYVLRPTFVATPARTEAATPVLQLATVAAAPGYATADLLVTRPDRRLDVFAASRWPDELPRVVAELALAALRGAAGLEAHDAAAPVAATHMLRLTVRRFDAEYRLEGSPPTVRVVIDAVVLRRSDRRVLGSFTTDSAVPTAENRLSVIVEAFERAAAEALTTTALRTDEIIKSSAARHGTATAGP